MAQEKGIYALSMQRTNLDWTHIYDSPSHPASYFCLFPIQKLPPVSQFTPKTEVCAYDLDTRVTEFRRAC